MINKPNKRNIFSDKATLTLRKILQDPKRKWVVRDFTKDEGVSLGLAQEVLEVMAKKGYVERIKRGPKSYTLLTYPDRLIKDWAQAYRFEFNFIKTYYTHDKNILKKMKPILDRSI